MDPLVTQHLHAADRNLAIASDLVHHQPDGLDAPAYEWVVTVSFYSAVRSVNAYIGFGVGVMPRTHGQRSRAILELAELRAIIDLYTRLENWSRDARYTSIHSAFNEEIALIALESARSIREHLRGHMPTS